ncbi:acetoin dehydrogenase [Pyrenophora tritici-repentis]|nr:acetoin dehydrogenase [Pyrenophora tritici-repentis]
MPLFITPRTLVCALPKLTNIPRIVIQAPRWTRNYASTAEKDRTAIVTGSARGIGKAIALRLANDGYHVCINDIEANKSSADEVVKEIQGLGRKAFAYTADVSKLSEVQAMVRASVSELGPLNTMVANAGIAQVKPLLDVTEEDLKRMFEINLYGVYHCYTTAAKQMISQGTGGKLIGAASVAAFKPTALLGHYGASKWAVRGLTHSFALELAEHKITANAYAPGIVGTAMWDLIDEKMGEKMGAKKGETFKKYKDVIALGRTSVPEDVSDTLHTHTSTSTSTVNMGTRQEHYTMNSSYPPPPSVEEDHSGSAESHLPQDLIYTIMNDYPEAYREYENIIHDFNHESDDTLHNLQSNSDDDESDQEEPSEEYETPPATPEHPPVSIKREVHQYTVPLTAGQTQHRQHHMPQLPAIVVNEHVQPIAAAPTHLVQPAYGQQIYERRSINGPIYPRQAYREHRSEWDIGGRRHGGYNSVADERRQRRCQRPRELYPNYEEEYMRARAENIRAAWAFEALSQAFRITRQIDGKMSALKALLAQVLRERFGEGM